MTRRAPPAILFVLSFLVATVGPGLRAQTSGEETFVRVFFDDLTTARQIAAGLEPLESKYEKGYLVVEVTPEQLQRLQQRGLRTEPVNPEELSEMLAPPRASRLDRTRKQSATTAVTGITGFPCYRTVEETFAAASSIAADNPTLASWIDVGDSWLKTESRPGYDMRVLVLTNANVSGPKPKMFVTSSIHAREYTPAELMTRFAEDLISNYGVAADATWLLDHHEVHLLLQANPDGRKQAEAGQLWRKNVNENYCGPASENRGADLNRNFDFMWDCCGGSSDDPCSNAYHGGYAASEPEVQAVQNYMRSIFPDQRGPNLTDPAPDDATGVYLDIHSSGQLILYPWGFTSDSAPNESQLQTLARKLGFFTLHFPMQGTDFDLADGVSDDFGYSEMGIAAFTLELGTEFFEDCSYFEETILPRNMASLYYAAKVARTPYMTPSGPNVVDGSLSLSEGEWPAVVTAGASVTLTATLSDSQFNNDNGVEPTQSVVSAEYYIDTPPWVAAPVPVPFTMVDVVDAPGDPTDGDLYEASIDTTGLSAGRHIVFVRGKDSDQSWGAFSAIFLGIGMPPPPPPPPPRGGGGGGGGGGLLFPPRAPASLAAMPGDGAVRLEWSPPASDGGSAIRRYEYRLKKGRGEFGEWTRIPDSAPDEVNASGYTVMDLGNGTIYVFELRGVNAAGNGRVSEAVGVTMPLDPGWWSNFRAGDLEGTQLMLEAFFSGERGDREVRFGEELGFDEDELDGDGEGEVTATRMGSYGYRYTSRTTGVLSLDFDGGEACEVRLTFSGEGRGSYSYRCGGSSRGQGSFRMSELVNRVPEITRLGPFEVEENRTRVGQLEAVDWDEEDEVTGYAIAGGVDEALFAIVEETGELSFREAPDYENPGDVASTEPQSGAGDNEYILVVEVTSGEGERERRREQVIRVRVSDVEMEEVGEGETGEDKKEPLFIPVILSSAGRHQSFFTSELTLTNRGEQEVELDYTYTARDEPEKRSGKASDVLAAGEQKIKTDALGYLRDLGVPIPETGNQLGTLRVEVPLGSEVEAVVRTTTVVPDGRAGLAYPGVAEEEGFTEAVYLCGLRQNSRDRSNVAFQHMGTPQDGPITLRATVFSGDPEISEGHALEERTLVPGGFHQYDGILSLAGYGNGYVKVDRVEGEAPFYTYGVINDQANSDGSFVFPVRASSLEGKRGQILPVIVETRDFTSELTVTNFSEEPGTLDFEFVSEQIEGEDKTVGFSMRLEAGEQRIIPEVVDELRQQGMRGLGTSRGFYAGPLFVVAEDGDMSGIVIGARTGSKGGGGSYSVFYNAVPEGGAFTKEAWVEGLQQNEENRSNLALVNTGEVDGSPSVFHLEIYNGETGLLEETVVTEPIPARGWHQIDGILLRSGPETRQGYIRIEKMSGENPFLAYGVVNDGGAPGERSGDGAYLPARE